MSRINVSYPEIKESFRDLLICIVKTEDSRPAPRYAGEEPALPSDKQTEYLEKIAMYLVGDEKLMSALNCIIEGKMLFKDQLNGYGLFEGLGILNWFFNLPNEWKIDNDIRQSHSTARQLQDALKLLDGDLNKEE